MVAEVFGAERMIFLKDVAGLYTRDPAVDREKAELIPKISLSALRDLKLSTLPLDPIVLDLMPNAKLIKEVQIVNGLRPGALTRALAGEPVGSIIYAD